MIIIHGTVFPGTIYSRPMPTKISPSCTSSFPAVSSITAGFFCKETPITCQTRLC